MISIRSSLTKLFASEVDVIERYQRVRWRFRRGNVKDRIKPFEIDPSHYTPGGPVSGSVEYGDLAKSRKFDFDMASLQSRGFYRFQKDYQPPPNAKEIIILSAKSSIPKLNDLSENQLMMYPLSNPEEKYTFLTKTHEEIQHGVPNSLLYLVKTIGDAVEFYQTVVSTNTPYDELARSTTLPPNLHIQKDPIRFHPDTDTMFGGVNAFTKSSTIVTGLRAKKKYKGFIAQKWWPPEDEEN